MLYVYNRVIGSLLTWISIIGVFEEGLMTCSRHTSAFYFLARRLDQTTPIALASTNRTSDHQKHPNQCMRRPSVLYMVLAT